jgi:hypothetical protein
VGVVIGAVILVKVMTGAIVIVYIHPFDDPSAKQPQLQQQNFIVTGSSEVHALGVASRSAEA